MTTRAVDRVEIPEIVETKLRGVRRRRTLLRCVELAAIPLTVLLAAMLLVMAIDWTMEIRAGWRAITTSAALLAAATAACWGLGRLLSTGRTLSSAALDVDRAVPSLGERWSTIAELSESSDPLAMKGAPSLIGKVSDEAEALAHLVAEDEIVSRKAAYRWAGACAAVVVVLLLAFAIGGSSVRLLWQRFFAPLSDLPFTRVTSLTGDRNVPKFEPLTIEAAVAGRPRDWATLQLRAADSSIKEVGLVRDPNEASKYAYTLRSVDEPLEYRIESGDGRTAWHRITPVERPSFAQIRFKVTPPEYTRLTVDQKEALPRSYRAVEGSRLEIEFLPSKPLKEIKLQTGDGGAIDLALGEGDWYRYEASLRESITLSASMTDHYGLSNLSPATTDITVYADQPPTVSVTAPNDNVALPPDDTVTVEFDANDDFGFTKAELILEISPAPPGSTPTTNPWDLPNEQASDPSETMPEAEVEASAQNDADKPITKVIPIPLDPADPQKSLRRSVDLDLKPLKLKTGQQVAYLVRVTDTRMAEATSGAPSPQQQQQQANAPQPSDGQANATTQPADASANEDNRVAQNSHPSKASKNPPDASPNKSEIPPKPPENVAKRWAPFPNTASSGKRSIKVDEWAGTAGNDARAKLEIAIDKFLADLDAALAAAQKPTDALKLHVAQKLNWTAAEDEQLTAARARTADASGVVSEAMKKTAGTPYAFMGLQLGDIGVSHVDPARKHLASASTLVENDVEQHRHLDRAAYHLAQARERLANLTREYEAIKNDNQLADAMQHLQKMHQLYLKDMMAILASSKPKLNPLTRKIQEIDEAMLEKLAERAEAAAELKRKLAEALAKDPELLKRMMARLRAEAINLRDVYTLQERQQQEQLRHVSEWMDTPPNRRQALREQLRAKEMAAAAEISEKAVRLDDDMKTWSPRNLNANRGPLADAHELSMEIALAAADAARDQSEGRDVDSLDAAVRATARIRDLNEALDDVLAENPDHEDVQRYVEFRRVDSAKLGLRLGLYIERNKALRNDDFARYARIEQTRLMTETLELQTKLQPVARMYAGVPKIYEKAKQLDREMTEDVVNHQQAASTALAAQDLQSGRSGQGRAVRGYATSSKTFDELRKLIVDHEDAKGLPKSIGDGAMPTLEDLLAQLEKEQRALEGLIDCMPVNIGVSTDWAMAAQGVTGTGMNGEIGTAAAQASQRAQMASQRLGPSGPEGPAEGNETLPKGSTRERAWDVHASQLQNDLRQVRGNSPPEEYRQAIEDYMRILADETSKVTPMWPAGPPAQ